MNNNNLVELAKQIRHNIVVSTSQAGTGHPTSSLSGVELMTQLFFGGFFRAILDNPQDPNNDRIIFSKGHACPLLYSMYYACGHLSNEELMSLRKFGSPIEGHPTMEWQYTEAATGSLGQGLGIAVGMAITTQKNFENEEVYPNVWCLLGDSEMAEGSIWEAMNAASYYSLNNLIAIVDMNRLGQRGQTQIGHNTENLRRKAEAFGWEVWVVEGHDLDAIEEVYSEISNSMTEKPKMVIAKTFKGAGISFAQDMEGFHGKAFDAEQTKTALAEIGDVDLDMVGEVSHPITSLKTVENTNLKPVFQKYSIDEKVATRKAYGTALNNIGKVNSEVVALDAEMNNSTYSEIFAKNYPGRYYEMFIAEQNMISTGVGMSLRGKIPFVSTFASFLSRANDQIRMAQYSKANLKIMGSHCGVSIGPDGSSQMAVEDLAFFRCILDSVVLYPSDAVSADRLTNLVLEHKGISYLRCTRAETPVIYSDKEEFTIGGSKTIFESSHDQVTIIAAGITLHEAIKAYKKLEKEGVKVRIVDLYSIKPIDKQVIAKASLDTKAIIVVEDHYIEGGIYEAICSSGVATKPVHSLSVKKMSCSGTPSELLNYMQIDSEAIVNKVKAVIGE
jgi:transketolase